MSGLLEKIFLGNVNEKGEVDQEGYDEDTKRGLTAATSKNKDSIVGDVVTENDKRVNEDDDTIQRDPHAVDYSREEEAVDDDDEDDQANQRFFQIANNLISQPPTSTSVAATRKTDDDYDEFDEEDDVGGADNVLPSQPEAQSAQEPVRREGGVESSSTADVPVSLASSASKRPVEAPVNVRRNGLLCFSDMIIKPPTMSSRMPSKRKHTSTNVKIEYMSDEEDKFVDEAARRAAAAAALRLREQHEAGEEEEKEEEEYEDDEEGGSLSRQESFRRPAADVDMPGSAKMAAVVHVEEHAEAEARDLALGGSMRGEVVDGGAAQAGHVAAVKTELPTWEARSWENDIVWGDSSDEDEADEEGEGSSEAVAGGKGESDDDEFDEDDLEAELDVEGDHTMRDHFGGDGAGGAGGSGGNSGCGGHKRGGGSKGGRGREREDAEEDDDKRRRIIQDRIMDAKRYFMGREKMPYQNAVRIGEYNQALEEGDWVKDIIWNDHDRKKASISRAARRASGARRLPLRRPVKGKDCASTLGQSVMAPHSHNKRVHACIPPWWSRRGPDMQARHVPLLDELVERLDLSHDSYYQEAGGTKARIKLGRPTVLHAPATRHLRERPVITRHTDDGYRTDFHRNRVFRDPKAAYSISFNPQDSVELDTGAAGSGKERKDFRGAEEKVQAMKHLKDITVKDSKNLLLEHLEEVPPLVSNMGMASRVKHYYRSKPDQAPPTIPPDALGDGKPVALDVQQESPFFDDLPEGPQAYVSAFENNMLRHPIAKHTPAETDFLVVCKGDKYYLRPINSLYCAGQCHPFLKVPAPHSKEREKYQRRHLMNFIFGRLSKGGVLQTHEVFDEFPATSETAIRKQLKDCAQFNREGGEGGHWTLKEDYKLPDDLNYDEADTPDMVCLHESLQAGERRLRNMGVKTLHRGDDVTAAVTEITKDPKTESVIRHGALCVQELLWRAPWNLTANFVQASEHRLQLNLSTVEGSQKAEELARRDELMASQRADLKEPKKAAAEYLKRRQTIFQEMLESISQQEPDASSEEEEDGGAGETEPYDEDGGVAAASAAGKGRHVYKKITIAHRWSKEQVGDSIRWRCTTIKDAQDVAKIVSDKKKRKPSDAEENGDERAKADARREKKRLQEQKRRKMKKMQKLGVASGQGSTMFLDDDEDSSTSRRPEKAGSIKITREAMLAHKNQKKRSARELPDHLLGKGRRTTKRRRLDPKQDLSKIFGKAVEAMKLDEKSVPFRTAVDSRTNPTYRTIIQRPIDLNIIKTRVEEGAYDYKKEFLEDVQLMVDNCRSYNETRDRRLVSDVMVLQQICQAKLEESKNTIVEAEAMIKLSEKLAHATNELMQERSFSEFLKPLNHKEYTAVVKKPMDLTTIHTKALNYAYSSRNGWLEDLKLLRDNCHLYCESRHPNLPPYADELLAQGQKYLTSHHEAIRSLEDRVGTWAHHSKAATPGTSYPGTPGLGRSVPGSPRGGHAERSPAAVDEEDEDLAADLAAGMEEVDDAEAGALEDELENAMEEDGDEIGDDEFGGDDELAEGMQAPAGGEF